MEVDRRPLVFMSDIDGTLAEMTGRKPWDWHRVGEDVPLMQRIRLIRAVGISHPVVFPTGRKRQCEDETREWFKKYVCDHTYVCFCRSEMRFRDDDDNRSSDVVKREYATGFTADGKPSRYGPGLLDRYNVQGVFEDRPQDVLMWRALGLNTYDVGWSG